jgi:N-acetylglucosaminyldiphosphoundecaprenol N-acetyl-beta-D-mannosaminyltransferase
MSSGRNNIELLNVHIDNLSKNEVIDKIVLIIKSNEKAIISNVNLHALNISYKNPWFRQFLNESKIVFCDGYGIHFAAAITGQKINYRFSPPDWIQELCQLASKNKWGIFFLGGIPNVAWKAAFEIKNSTPDAEITSHHGYFEKIGPENEKVICLINKSKAKFLLVGMGMPLQEQWIKENFDKFSDIQIIMPVGALFSYISKTTKRGHQFLTNHGFEWLTRLVIEPRRLWYRYLIGIPQVLFRIIRHHYFHNLDHSD